MDSRSVDMAQAGAKLADGMNTTVPGFDDESCWDLKALRHPLLVLQGKNVIPNDVILTQEQQVLVVSGPTRAVKQ